MTAITIHGDIDTPITSMTAFGVAVALRAVGQDARMGWGAEAVPRMTLTTEGTREAVAEAVIAAAQQIEADLAGAPLRPYTRYNKTSKKIMEGTYCALSGSSATPPYGARKDKGPAILAAARGWDTQEEAAAGTDAEAREFWDEATAARREVLDTCGPVTRGVLTAMGPLAYWVTSRVPHTDSVPEHGTGWWSMGEARHQTTQALTVYRHARLVAALSVEQVLASIEHGDTAEYLMTKDDIGQAPPVPRATSGDEGTGEVWSVAAACGFRTGGADVVRVFCSLLATTLSTVVPQYRGRAATSSVVSWSTAAIPLPGRPVPLAVIENVLRSALLAEAVGANARAAARAAEVLVGQGIDAVLVMHREDRGAAVPTYTYNISGAVRALTA